MAPGLVPGWCWWWFRASLIWEPAENKMLFHPLSQIISLLNNGHAVRFRLNSPTPGIWWLVHGLGKKWFYPGTSLSGYCICDHFFGGGKKQFPEPALEPHQWRESWSDPGTWIRLVVRWVCSAPNHCAAWIKKLINHFNFFLNSSWKWLGTAACITPTLTLTLLLPSCIMA